MPNMATMLSFIVTDAAVDAVWLRKIFQEIADSTFNCISRLTATHPPMIRP
jgi:glutamate N-acetyltransferase/amino-acid N-acetyltransferase